MSEKTARVLLVEDDEDDYILTSDYLHQLTSYTFKVDWVTTPTEALEHLKHNVHDICLLDYQLGAYNGLTVLEKASEQGSLIPIIMLTGQSDEQLDQLALSAGAVDYIVKSDISTSRFDRAIRYALARKEIENERFERVKAETRNRSKDRFLAHLSHELRTPLTSILGYTEVLLSSEKGALAQTELNVILNNGQHLLGLLNNVLDLSKIAVGKLDFNITKVKLNSLLAEIFSLMHVHADNKGLQLKVESAEALPEWVFVDATKLRQILINLVYNAIKFTDKGIISINVSTNFDNGKEMLSFDVTDTGQGIPADMLDNIFKPFEQVEDIVSRKEEGAGLGLAICSELVKRMGGDICVESKLNCGSRFSFYVDPGDLKKQQRSMLDLNQQLDSKDSNGLASLTGRVLVVDDIEDIRTLIGHFCLSFGLQVEYAENGLEAIERQKLAHMENQPFDVILMDIHMPKLDGRKAIVELRNLGFSNPIFAITAATMKGVKEELKNIGFSDVIDKPIDRNILYAKLATQLNTPAKINSKAESPNQLRRILLVEDDNDAAEVTKLLMESLGVEVKIAASAQQCIEILKEDSHWHKILLDFHLPDQNGLLLSRDIKEEFPDMEIILISGAEMDQTALDKSGISRSIMKPVNLAILKSLV
ncbi:MAG: hypothetical protein Alis3KO_39420 [Aliiglaciecola sp.]